MAVIYLLINVKDNVYISLKIICHERQIMCLIYPSFISQTLRHSSQQQLKRNNSGTFRECEGLILVTRFSVETNIPREIKFI